MANSNEKSARFFDDYPRFLESTETGPWLERLNARHHALIETNRDLISGSRVLDLGSHDGRFAFAALEAGASHVTGIDVKAHLAESGAANMEAYGMSPDRYAFNVGDLFDFLATGPEVDVVFCFGILYHLSDHLRLLTAIAELGPKAVIIDSKISLLSGAVMEIRSPRGDSPPLPGAQLEAYSTPAALNAMVSSLGWDIDYFDWARSGLLERPNTQDYREGSRISARITCPDHAVSAEVRQAAVADVLASDHPREQEFLAVSMVADRVGMAPQALAVWVNKARRERSRQSGFTR